MSERTIAGLIIGATLAWTFAAEAFAATPGSSPKVGVGSSSASSDSTKASAQNAKPPPGQGVDEAIIERYYQMSLSKEQPPSAPAFAALKGDVLKRTLAYQAMLQEAAEKRPSGGGSFSQSDLRAVLGDAGYEDMLANSAKAALMLGMEPKVFPTQGPPAAARGSLPHQ